MSSDHRETEPDDRNPEVLVLLSGGIDSAACAHFYVSLGRPTCAMHIQYGQRAAGNELAAARRVAAHYKLKLYVRSLSEARPKSATEIVGRNAFLIFTAVLEHPVTVRAIALGIHAGTPYADCSVSFIQRVNALLSAQGVGVEILAPFAEWHKGDIGQYCRKYNVPIDITYSCERGGTSPCGKCISCLDRRSLDART